MIATKVIDEIQKVFPLNVDEVLKLQMLLAQGHDLVGAGVSVWWYTTTGDRVRTTTQITTKGLIRIPDCTQCYTELMEDLDSMEACQYPELPTQALYFYTLKKSLHFHVFFRK